MTSAPFFMVCKSPRHPGARTEPKQRYATEADARTAAQALADEHDAPFVVLRADVTIWPRSHQPALF